jgi:Fe-S cluster assembly scaffold protein SufB
MSANISISDLEYKHEVAYLGADAQLNWNYAAVGGDTSKNYIRIEMEGKGSQANLNGVMFPVNGQVVNLDTARITGQSKPTAICCSKVLPARKVVPSGME